jgi:CBS domain-containing protein
MRPEDDLALASQIMVWAGIRHLPVVRDDALVGVISERDILRHEAKVGAKEGARDRVESAMSTPVEVVDIDSDLSDASAKMLDRRIGCLPVVKDDRLVGIITTQDILGHQARRRYPAAAWPAHAEDVMTGAPKTAGPGENLLDVVARMRRERVRHLPVVDEQMHVVGMLSDRDVRAAVGDPRRAAAGDAEAAAQVRFMKVADAMSTPALVGRQDEPLPEIARHFLDWRVGALPIVDAQERLVGIVSYLDVLDAVYAHYWDMPSKDAQALIT